MSQHVVVIGAVALGPKAASRLKRLDPDAKVTMLDQSERISYGGCGIPFYVAGEVNSSRELMETPYHTVRDAAFFRNAKNVDVITGARAIAIDRTAKTVTYVHLATGKEETISYDKLVLGLGKRPRTLDIPGADLPGVHTLTDLDQAEAVRATIEQGKAGSVAVVGAGFIGLETAVSFADMWGLDTTVVEYFEQILPGFVSPGMARMAQRVMEDEGVTFRLGESLNSIEPGGDAALKLTTDKGAFEADMVIMSVGVIPNSELAKEAGLDVSERGGILVDAHMRTSDPDIYAGGDCVEITNLITGKPGFFPMGSMANRQGRVVGTNLAAKKPEDEAAFPGSVGAWCCKLFEYGVAGAGLSITQARREGFDAVNVHVEQLDRAHFYPDKALMSLELVVEKATGRVLGIQGLSETGDALVGRVNTVAAILDRKPHVSDISNLELAYSPPYAAAMDIVNALGNVAENVLAGRNRGVGTEDFLALWESGAGGPEDGHYILDTRVARDAEPYLERFPERWHAIPQDELRSRRAEIPADKKLVLICNTGLRSYESQRVLDELGLTDTENVQGGMAAVKKTVGDL